MSLSPPLRFLALVIGGWAAARGVMLWPAAELPAARPSDIAGAALPPAKPDLPAAIAASSFAQPTLRLLLDPPAPARTVAATTSAAIVPAIRPGPDPAAPALTTAPGPAAPPPFPPLPSPLSDTASLPRDALAPSPRSRVQGGGPALTGYGWAHVRRGSGLALVPGSGQLGGSQAGVAAQWRLGATPLGRLSATGRISGALARRQGKEAAVGVALRPFDAIALELAAERRIAIDRGGRNAFALALRGGVSEVALPAGFRLDGYGQAGVVGLARRDGFIDAQAIATRPVASAGALGIRAGGGVWGAAQPGVARLDFGPELEARIVRAPIDVRIAASWRVRAAGNARPGSGPALTISTGW